MQASFITPPQLVGCKDRQRETNWPRHDNSNQTKFFSIAVCKSERSDSHLDGGAYGVRLRGTITDHPNTLNYPGSATGVTLLFS